VRSPSHIAMAQISLAAVPRHARLIAAAALMVLAALAWRYLLRLAHAVALEDMGVTTNDLIMMLMPAFNRWGNHDLVVAFAMWAVVMVGFLAPAFATRRDSLVITGQVMACLVLSIAAAFAQASTERLALEAWVVVHAATSIGGAVLIVAGVYQWFGHRRFWPLAVLLFFGGVMNLAWIAVIAMVTLIERAMPAGKIVARLVGVGLMVAGGALIAMAALTP
jgi:predicted metal-binding membrane protein